MPYSVQFVRIQLTVEVDGKDYKRYFQMHVLYGTSIGTFRRDHDKMIKSHIAEMILEDVELDDDEYYRRLDEYDVEDDMICFHNDRETLLDEYRILKEQSIKVVYEDEEFADDNSTVSSEPPPKKQPPVVKSIEAAPQGRGTRKSTRKDDTIKPRNAKGSAKASTPNISLTAEKLAAIPKMEKTHSEIKISELASF